MIIESAILQDGKIYTGKRHYNIMHEHPYQFKFDNCIQGFITDDGKFLDRYEALKYAIACGQIEKGRWGDELYSEDLY